ncbi:Fibronectin type III domain-containing protein [Treponema sp. JC4]|uniref:bacterial Ig-like domain-containing protein n=1 Tax=Treponema sp. JC4 TaxID=1124982 RepID=UPI00025AFBF6|nr:bacterial Ig-like domain-containing protein [Treponema sp. JC4]EID85122.1 Fibronectin type III domain-containing protein [Treponema sp. JC4]
MKVSVRSNLLLKKITHLLTALCSFSLLIMSCAQEAPEVKSAVNVVWDYKNVSAFSGRATGTDSVLLSWSNPNTENFAKLVISASPANGSLKEPKETTESSYEVTGLTAGTNYVFTIYAYDKNGNKSTGSSISVKTDDFSDDAITSLKVTNSLTKTEYYKYEKPDLDGLSLVAVYKSGREEKIAVSELTVSPEAFTEAGSQNLYITYKDQVVKIPVEVLLTTLESISIKKTARKTSYQLGDDVDLTGLVLEANYSDSITKEVKDFSYSPKTLFENGFQKITLTYGNKSVTYDVYVSNNQSFDLDITIISQTDLNKLFSYKSEAKTFVAKDTYVKYEWYLDGTKRTDITNGFFVLTKDIIDPETTEYNQNHVVMLVVTDEEGYKYSQTAEFRIR